GRVASQTAHHRPAEEEPEHEPPARGIPVPGIEPLLLSLGSRAAERVDLPLRMDERQHPAPEGAQVALELPHMNHAAGDRVRVGIPEGYGPRAEVGTQPAIGPEARGPYPSGMP